MAYVRGPEGIIVSLAERVGSRPGASFPRAALQRGHVNAVAEDRLGPDDVVLRAEREAGDVLGAVLFDDEDVVLTVAAGARLPLGDGDVGSIETTMPGSSTVLTSSRSSSPASRP